MIPRYSRAEMASLWEPQTRFRIWFEIEAYACDALAEIGIVPKAATEMIWQKGKDLHFDVARIDAIEKVTKHDVIAFLTYLAEEIGPEARFLHLGMTSSDLLDTCFAVQLTRAADLLIKDTEALLAALKRRAFEYKLTPSIGRSHGIHAEPVTFGLKLAEAYAEFSRARTRLVAAREEIATCAISGAVGTRSPISIRASKSMSRKSSASGPSRFRPRSFRATGMRCFLRRSASSPRRSSGWPRKFVICNAPRCSRLKNIFPRGKRAPRPCRTNATLC